MHSSRKNTSTADRSLFDIDANMKVFKNPRLKVISHRKKVRGARAQALTPTLSQKGEGARMKCRRSFTGRLLTLSRKPWEDNVNLVRSPFRGGTCNG
jgi:hypothetical protein